MEPGFDSQTDLLAKKVPLITAIAPLAAPSGETGAPKEFTFRHFIWD
jgi:hypothetical protein